MILPRDLTFEQNDVQIITHVAKDIHIYKVNDDEIEKLSHSAGYNEFTYFISTLSTCLAFIIAYVTRTEYDFIRSSFMTASVGLFIMAFYFYKQYRIYLQNHTNLVDEIKARACLE